MSTLQKVEVLGQKEDHVNKPTAYPTREALPTHMDLLQPENGVMGSTTDAANLTVALTQTMQEVLQAVTWDEVCVANMSNGAGDPCSAHPLLQHQATWETHWEGCQHYEYDERKSSVSRVDFPFSPGDWKISQADIQICLEDSCSDSQYLEIASLEDTVGDLREPVGTVETKPTSRKCAGPIDHGQYLPSCNHTRCYAGM